MGIGYILHFVSEILPRAAEKMLAVRQSWAQEHPDVLRRLVRAHGAAASFVEDQTNREEVLTILSAPNRIGADAEVIGRTLDGRLKISPDGTVRESDRYLMVGRKGAARPDPVQAAWLYAQMVRWGQAPLSRELLEAAQAVWRPDLYDAALPADGSIACRRAGRRDRCVRGAGVRSERHRGPPASLDHQALDERIALVVRCTKFPQDAPQLSINTAAAPPRKTRRFY